MPLSAPAPAPSSRTSPVTAAYARLTEALPVMSVTEFSPTDPLPEGDGWVSAAGLAAGGAELDAFLAWDEAQIERDHGQKGRPDVVAAFGLHRYSWYACLLFTVPWFLQRRVPRFPAEHVAFQREQSRLAVRAGTFSCLPGDPAAGEPGARVVPDEEALRAEVRAAFAEHIEPVLGGFGPRMRRRGRALWGMATDEVVEGIWYIAELLDPGEQERCRRELELLLPGSTRPYVGAAGFRELAGPGGRSLPTRDRASCCMFYTLAPEDTCITCPRTCDADRIAKLTATAAA
ncbi:uncharacterized protein SGFS_032780 [Streptomyces graminofaciens]|uniref:Ferric siderophore reductase C-terminal domain-containing protein n=1 Tax=Streptomyces graminofaciens TaxID=68212 RepID=A0ABM7F7U0_9ACTN|nr:(2Fe-2S)-binding protein [Streptomyces graminofaciens]BBC31984.1 uncharacterized protein SGFS_032780 [Streptomyces graminofaciens]